MNPDMHGRHPKAATKSPSDSEILEWLGVKAPSETVGSNPPELGRQASEQRRADTRESERTMSWRGAWSEVVVSFVNINDRSEIRRVTVHGLGPSGEKLALYESRMPPTGRVSDALVKLLKSRPRNVNIDQYLTDIADLLRSDRRNDLVLVRPARTPDRHEVYPMEVEAPGFLEFAKAPVLLANRFVAAWERDSCRYDLRGIIAPDNSGGRLEITTRNELDSVISTDCFDIIPIRGSFSSVKERHNHIRTLIWEAIELCRKEGLQTVEAQLQRSKDARVTWDDEAGASAIGSYGAFSDYPQTVNGELVQVCESAGGAKVFLEVVPAKAAMSIVLPMQELLTSVIFEFEPTTAGETFSRQEIRTLKGLAADLTSEDKAVRVRAREALVHTAARIRDFGQPVEMLYLSPEEQKKLAVMVTFKPHRRDEDFLIDWVLDGYHPAIIRHDFLSPKNQRGTNNFTKMILGLSEKGDLKLELFHAHRERCSAYIPVGEDGDLPVAYGRAKDILDVFTKRDLYSWDQILGRIQELSAEVMGGRVRHESEAGGRVLPPLADKEGIAALALATRILIGSDPGGPWATYDSFRMYTKYGEAMALIRYRGTPLSMAVTVRGNRVIRVECYDVGDSGQQIRPQGALFSLQPRFNTADSDKIVAALGKLSEAFAEQLQNSPRLSLNTQSEKAKAVQEIFMRAVALGRLGAAQESP
jgi:hypothetical protein